MPTSLRTLIVEDSEADLELLLHELDRAGFAPAWRRAETEDEYLAELHPDLDVILADYSLPQFSALEALHLLHARGLDVPFIVVSGTISEEVAVECMKHGATDYLLKDRLARLGQAVERAIEQARLRAEAREAEKERALRRASEEAARAKDEIVSIVSHEIRTPLASLVGFAELLLTRDYGEQERRQYLQIMLEDGRRLAALVDDFLDLQRLESGRQVFSLAPLDLRQALEHAAASAGHDPRCPILLDLPQRIPLVLADAHRLQQVLSNLLSNARKYSPDGGEVRVSACPGSGAVEVTVADCGLGLPPEALGRLFTKFYRVDTIDRRAIKGTGLGLAICRTIIEAHGGTIRAESPGPGQGTRVSFTLPVAEGRAATGYVLVVEDNPGFARLLEAELERRGYPALRVSSAEAALNQLAAARPLAMLLDLMLPGLSGDAFLRRFRDSGGASLPVVVVSVTDPDPRARATLAELGVLAVLRRGSGAAADAALAVARALGADVGAHAPG